ncbi:MAG: hypothetical protein JNM24_04975 [Bdellovibrionaceae bacterium]|nr:hypothetical protein [Pseudobdellovibrionaceae bacterium]
MVTKSIILRQAALALLFIVSFCVVESAHAQDGGAKKSKGLSADIYEKEDSAVKSFTGHVNLIRETDTVEVFFDGKYKGPYLLKDDPNLGAFKEKLIKSQKNKNQNVTVKVSEDVITSVELVENKAPQQKKSDTDSVLDDILKK